MGASVLVAVGEMRQELSTGLRWAIQLSGVSDSVVLVVQDGRPEQLPVTSGERTVFGAGASAPAASSLLGRNGASFRVVADTRDPVVALPELAAQHNASMIVVDDAFLDRSAVPVDVALSQLLAQVQQPVLTVPEQGQVGLASLRRLVVVVDQPSLPKPALGMIRDLATAFDSWVSVVLVSGQMGHDEGWRPLDGSDALALRAQLEHICRPLRRNGVPVYRWLKWGSPQDAIRDVVAALDPGLVVVGVRRVPDGGDPLRSIDRAPARDRFRPTMLVPEPLTLGG